jgi:N-acetylglucosamine repressor
LKYFGISNNHTAISSQQATKEANAKLLFRIIEREGQISRAQLSRISGLSRSTVSVLTEEMIRNHMLLEAGEGESEPTGRKPILLEVDPSGLQIPCFAFRPTGLLFVLYDLKYQIIEQCFLPYGARLERVKADAYKKYVNPPEDDVIDLFDEIINERSRKTEWDKVRALTISFPGSFDWKNNTFTSIVLGWAFGSRFIDNLRARFSSIPLLVGNLSALLAYAEKKADNSNRDNLLYIHIGQGVGAGIILNNQPFTGESGISGEIGRHIVSKYQKNDEIHCTRLEDIASITSLMRRVRDGIKNGENTVLLQMCGYNAEAINIPMIRKALEQKDGFVMEIIKEIAVEISSVISNTLCVLGSMDVFIGGGIEELGPGFLKLLQDTMAHIGYHRVLGRTKVQYTRLPINGDCLGAAKAYVDNQLVVI